jgi:membrane associated rhomboid family serine protease
VTYELVLISVVIGAGYWGVFFVRQRPHGTATFGIMQLAAAGMAGLGLIGRKVDAPALGVLGAIGAGAGLCLLVVGPVVRVLARRIVAAERVGLATRLLDLAELLAPGSGVAEEKALLHAMTEIREGRIEQTVDALTAAKQRAPAEARLAIDERIAMLYVTAYRWRDAIAHAEAHLFGAPRPPEDAGAGTGTGDNSLRGALGVAPPVWVEMLGAYGRTGDLDQAARMLARLEDVCAGRDDAALWIHRARLMFLALAGRIDAVRALVARRRARHMSAAARTYWIAVAHDHRGDRALAAAAYQKARVRSRGRPRELIDLALARLAEPAEPAEPRPPQLAAVTSEVIARVEAAPLPAPIRAPRSRGPRATWLLAAGLLAVSAITALAIGETNDNGVFIRAGALVRGMVDAGEWWRLVACVFVHVGVVHLVLNAIGLVILGRLAEDLFGGARVIAIFGVAGVAGALASYLASPDGISAGASGAVFGLLGAVFVEITWHRERYRSAWRRGLWGGLAVVTVGQLGYGFLYPVIDQWAHGAGLLAGSLVGIVVSPNARWARAGVYLARAIALLFAAFTLTAGVLVARTSLADSLTAGGTAAYQIDGFEITAPAHWTVSNHEVFQPDRIVIVSLAALSLTDITRVIRAAIDEETRPSKDGPSGLTIAREPLVVLPDGWQGAELEAAPEDAMGYHQRMRRVVCGRAFGDQLVVMTILVPETVAAAAPELLAGLIASTRPISRGP